MAQPKKTGLGKGLDALFGGVSINEQPQETVVEEKSEINDNLKSLKITEVEPNRDQPRKQFKQEALEDLAESIKTYGIIQPIVVTKQDGYYGIVAGERRWRAAKLAGLEEIPAIIREDDEQKNREIALIENIQREDLNPYEKALGIRNLMDKYGLTQEEVSKRIGKSRSAVSNTVRILNLAPDVLELVKEGKLSEGHCKAGEEYGHRYEHRWCKTQSKPHRPHLLLCHGLSCIVENIEYDEHNYRYEHRQAKTTLTDNGSERCSNEEEHQTSQCKRYLAKPFYLVLAYDAVAVGCHHLFEVEVGGARSYLLLGVADS